MPIRRAAGSSPQTTFGTFVQDRVDADAPRPAAQVRSSRPEVVTAGPDRCSDAMNDRHLNVYLNDHLSGALAGIKLAEDCRAHNPDGPLHEALSDLLLQIREDRDVLQDIQSRVHGTENPLKKLMTWLLSRMIRLKLQNLFFAYTDLTRLEELEGLMLGIRGKLALWSSLEAAAGSDDRFADIDFSRLQQRARRQLDLLEPHHVQAAADALAD